MGYTPNYLYIYIYRISPLPHWIILPYIAYMWIINPRILSAILRMHIHGCAQARRRRPSANDHCVPLSCPAQTADLRSSNVAMGGNSLHKMEVMGKSVNGSVSIAMFDYQRAEMEVFAESWWTITSIVIESYRNDDENSQVYRND